MFSSSQYAAFIQRSTLVSLLVFFLTIWMVNPIKARFNGDFSIYPHTLDSENFLDWKSYRYITPWRLEWQTTANGFGGVVGSLSMSRFYLWQEIRLEKSVTSYLDFLYQLHQDSLFRDEPVYQEVGFRFGGVHAISIIGFTPPDKTQINEGVAYSYGRRHDYSYLRLSHLKQFALYNEQSEGSESFARQPTLQRLEGRYLFGEQLLVQVDLHREPLTELHSPAEAKKESYRGGKISLNVDWLASEGVIGFNYDRNFETRQLQNDKPTVLSPNLEQTLRWGWFDLFMGWRMGNGGWLEGGALRAWFYNQIQSPTPGTSAAAFRHFLYTDLAYLIWDYPLDEGIKGRFMVMAGNARYLLEGSHPYKMPDKFSRTESKFGIGLILSEEDSHRFLFNSTWDLDFYEQRRWDGGNVQLLMAF